MTDKLSKNARFIIRNAKMANPDEKSLHGACIENEKQYVSDGYRILEINNPIDRPLADTVEHFDYMATIKMESRMIHTH